MSLAIVPGSFDPITLGHLELIREASKLYDEVVVAVMINDQKQYLFDMESRVRMAELTVCELSNVRVIADYGMLIDLFDRLNADVVFKSYRNESDLKYETEMAEWNRAHNPRFVTKLIPSFGAYQSLSSTDVRNCMMRGEVPVGAVSEKIHPFIQNKIKETVSK